MNSIDLSDSISNLKKEWKESIHKFLEEFKTKSIVRQLNEHSLCIDCGANIGLITQIFAEKGATVYAFEPNPIPFKEMEQKFLNNKRVYLIPKGVSVKNEKKKLYKYQYHIEDDLFWSIGASTYLTKDDVDKECFIEIECIDIVKFILSLSKEVDILKIDIEGGEYDIIEKIIEENLHKRIKHILVETHDNHIPEIIPKGIKVRDMIKKNEITNIDLDWL